MGTPPLPNPCEGSPKIILTITGRKAYGLNPGTHVVCPFGYTRDIYSPYYNDESWTANTAAPVPIDGYIGFRNEQKLTSFESYSMFRLWNVNNFSYTNPTNSQDNFIVIMDFSFQFNPALSYIFSGIINCDYSYHNGVSFTRKPLTDRSPTWGAYTSKPPQSAFNGQINNDQFGYYNIPAVGLSVTWQKDTREGWKATD